MIDKNIIDTILKLNTLNNKRLLLNGNYVCMFTTTNNAQDCSFFSSFEKNESCKNSESCYADVIVYDHVAFKKLYGRVILQHDLDLGSTGTYSICLYIKENEQDNDWKSMLSIVKCEIQDIAISIVDFMKLIKFKSLRNVKEPYDSLGLTVCEFTEFNMMLPYLEFNIDGQLYFEILDKSLYVQGQIIPPESRLRKDVIRYIKITDENKQEIANKINASLERLYNIEQKES